MLSQRSSSQSAGMQYQYIVGEILQNLLKFLPIEGNLSHKISKYRRRTIKCASSMNTVDRNPTFDRERFRFRHGCELIQ
jgi:hypothetical protein